MPANFIKKKLWHRCFPLNFAKFLRTPFSQNTNERLLLYFWALLLRKSRINWGIQIKNHTSGHIVIKYGSTRKEKNYKTFLIKNGIYYMKRIKNRKKKQNCRVKEWLLKCDLRSEYNTNFKGLHPNDQEYCKRYLRTNTKVYEVKF